MENLKGRDYLRGLGIDGRVINYYIGSKGVDWQERSNEPSGSVTSRQFLDHLNHLQLLERNFPPWSEG